MLATASVKSLNHINVILCIQLIANSNIYLNVDIMDTVSSLMVLDVVLYGNFICVYSVCIINTDFLTE